MIDFNKNKQNIKAGCAVLAAFVIGYIAIALGVVYAIVKIVKWVWFK